MIIKAAVDHKLRHKQERSDRKDRSDGRERKPFPWALEEAQSHVYRNLVLILGMWHCRFLLSCLRLPL